MKSVSPENRYFNFPFSIVLKQLINGLRLEIGEKDRLRTLVAFYWLIVFESVVVDRTNSKLVFCRIVRIAAFLEMER